MKTTSSIVFLVFFGFVLKGQNVVFPPLPDSCFDVLIFNLPAVQTTPAREKFTRQLDSLLALPHPDTFTLAVVYRRLSAVLYLSSRGPNVHGYALKSLRLLENLSPRNELEVAKSRLVYAYSLFLIGGYDTILTIIKEAIPRNKVIFGELSQIQALHYRVLASSYNNLSRYDEAFLYIDQAVRIEKSMYISPNLQLAKSLYIRGNVFFSSNKIEVALQDLSESAAIVTKIWGKEHPALSSIYHFAGNACKEFGDIDRALEFYKQSLVISEQTLGPNADQFIYTTSWIADIFLETGDFQTAISLQEKAWKGYTQNNTITVGADKAYKMIQLYAIVGDHKKEAQAFKYLTEACGDFGKYGRVHEYNAFGYHYHAFSLLKQKRSEEALLAINQALEIKEAINPGNHRLQHESLLLKAEILAQLQRLDEAIALLQAIIQQSPLLDKKKQALAQLANIHFKKFKHLQQQNELQIAWIYQFDALRTLDSMRYSFQSTSSRIQQAELNFHLFESALNTSFERQDLENSFWVAEKSKASALLDNQRDDLARRIAGLPDSLLYRESGLKSQIAELEKTVYEKPSGSEKTNAEAALFEKKQNLNTLLQNFEKNYPLYFKFKYNTTLANVKQLQANLPPATAMLEYFVGDSSIFIFSITAQHLQLQRIAKPKDFEATIQNLRQALTSAELRFLNKDFSAFSTASSTLYDHLLFPVLPALPPNIQHLIIIPDGTLNYIPFEILGKNSSARDFKSYPYLLKNFSISYAVSANLWLEQAKDNRNLTTQRSSLNLFAGFAPSYNSSDTLSSISSRTRSLLVRDEQYEIPGAALEVQEIAKLLNGKTWLGEAATKNQFRQQAPHFQVLHLAMHSIMDDTNPLFSRLLFTQPKNTLEDNDLYANDLYNMRLPAEMVVLSACNTGNGKLRRGEGVMSLSRAFTYTGVPATVMSLWKAPDEATRKLMFDFYQNLKMGLSKSEALQKAKLDQLLKAEPGLSNPFFWAGFVANGDMKALLRQ